MLDKKELHRNNLTYVKMYPALFGQKQACENRPMCRSVAGYINALYNDEGFREDFEIFEEGKSLSEKKLNSLYSEQAYKRYKERYEETLEDLKIENDLIIQEGFKEYKFNSFESCFKYIKAIKDLLYHASVKTQEDAVIKLTSWIQWFRAGLSKDRRLKVDSSALFFFSALGGTGKSEILHSLAAACDELGIPTDYLTTADISDKFSPRAIKDANLIIIEDAEFISRLGNDINLHKLNSLIDRSKFTFIEKFKEPETITPNVTIIGATNNRYINRRYSNIIIKNQEIEVKKHNPPTPERLKQAWIDAIYNCPDPHKIFINVKTKNQRSSHFITDNMIKIYDMLGDDGQKAYQELGVRSIIDKISKGGVSPRATEFILQDIKLLINLNIAKQIVSSDPKKKKQGLRVSKVEFNVELFRELIGSEDTDEQSIKLSDVEEIIIKHYIANQQILNDNEIIELKSELREKERQLEMLKNTVYKGFNKKQLEKEREKDVLKLETDIYILNEKIDKALEFDSLIQKTSDAQPPPN